jgi:hypothetical protein
LTIQGVFLRASKEEQLKALKVSTFRLIDACGDGEALPLTRVKSQGTLSKYKAMHEMESFIPIDVVFDLELVWGVPIITETLAKLHGKKLVADERLAAESDVDAIRDSLDAIEDDVARLRLVTRGAIGDAKIDAGEKVELRRAIDKVRMALGELEGLL